MKGKIIPLSFLHTQDSETGHQVIRMTPPHVICHRNYFYQKCFTRDGSKLIFGGAFEGHWNYYLLDIAGTNRPPSSPTGRAITPLAVSFPPTTGRCGT